MYMYIGLTQYQWTYPYVYASLTRFLPIISQTIPQVSPPRRNPTKTTYNYYVKINIIMEHMSTKNWALNNITDTIPKLEMKMVHQESKYYKQVGLLHLPPSAPNLYIAIIGGGGGVYSYHRHKWK